MFVIAVACFPVLLLLLMLSMERVERPLRDETIGERIVAVLDSARPDEVEVIVSGDAALPVDRYWRRIRRRGRLFVRRASGQA